MSARTIFERTRPTTGVAQVVAPGSTVLIPPGEWPILNAPHEYSVAEMIRRGEITIEGEDQL
jgi:hypothetical protein